MWYFDYMTDKTISRNFRIPVEMWDEVARIAYKEMRPISAEIKILLRMGLEEYSRRVNEYRQDHLAG